MGQEAGRAGVASVGPLDAWSTLLLKLSRNKKAKKMVLSGIYGPGESSTSSLPIGRCSKVNKWIFFTYHLSAPSTEFFSLAVPQGK